MKINIVSYSIGIIVAGVFLLSVLTPPSAFNFIELGI